MLIVSQLRCHVHLVRTWIVYTIYSRMGGGGAVVRGEGVFESDTML